MSLSNGPSRPTALVTGGAGFVGSYLVTALLQRDWNVVALDDFSTGSRANVEGLGESPRLRLVEGSVLDQPLIDSLVARSDVVYHLAAAVGVRLIMEQPLRSMMTNIRGTEQVLEAAARRSTRVLLASSSEVYGKPSEGQILKEDDDQVIGSSRKLRWSYAIAKTVDEMLALMYHRELGLGTVCVRIFNAVGPGQQGTYGMVVPRFIDQAQRREPLTIYGDGTQSRVFTYAGDVADALIRLMDARSAAGMVVNVAGGPPVTINQLADMVKHKVGSTSPVVHMPFEQVYGPDAEDVHFREADTSRLQEITGFRCATPLEEILDLMLAGD